ncbi:hypothetical protein [Paraglaciecola sp.]|uniref:hypothetical protein n=1 Tax=Paraglaciecola sp. TaxID=1920173 RepID=UPI0030F39E4A
MFTVDNLVLMTIRPELIDSYKLVKRNKTYKEKGYSLMVKQGGSYLKIQKEYYDSIMLPEYEFHVVNAQDMEKVIRLGEAVKRANIKFLLANYPNLEATIFSQIHIGVIERNSEPCWTIGRELFAISKYPTLKLLMKKWIDENTSYGPEAYFGKVPFSLIRLLIKDNYKHSIVERFLHTENQLELIFFPDKKSVTLTRCPQAHGINFNNIELDEIPLLKNIIEREDYDKLLDMDDLEFEDGEIELKCKEYVHEHFYLAAKLSNDLSQKGYWLRPKAIFSNNYSHLTLNRSSIRLNTNDKKEAITLVESGECISDSFIEFQLIQWSVIRTAIENKKEFTISEGIAKLSFSNVDGLTLEFDGLIYDYKVWDIPIDSNFDIAIKNAFYELKNNYLNATKDDYTIDPYTNYF